MLALNKGDRQFTVVWQKLRSALLKVVPGPTGMGELTVARFPATPESGLSTLNGFLKSIIQICTPFFARGIFFFFSKLTNKIMLTLFQIF